MGIEIYFFRYEFKMAMNSPRRLLSFISVPDIFLKMRFYVTLVYKNCNNLLNFKAIGLIFCMQTRFYLQEKSYLKSYVIGEFFGFPPFSGGRGGRRQKAGRVNPPCSSEIMIFIFFPIWPIFHIIFYFLNIYISFIFPFRGRSFMTSARRS